MLDFLDKLDEKLYSIWQQKAQDVLEQLQRGFNQITFGDPEPEEIKKIRDKFNSISGAKSRTEYADAIKNIKENLETLAINKDFNNTEVNNFIFQGRRSMNWLWGALITNYNKYAQAFLNPGGKAAPPAEKGGIQKFIEEEGAKRYVDYLTSSFDEDVTSFLKLQVKNLQGDIAIKKVDNIAATTSASLLKQKMGAKQYEKLQSQIPINSASDVPAYLSEQIYGQSFELFYTQVAQMQDILTKINKLAEKGLNANNIAKIRTDLLNKAGLAELDPDGINYLDALAKVMGFENAKMLHQNFSALDTEEGYEQFKAIKEKFVQEGKTTTDKEADPLEKIRVEIAKEHERVKNKIKSDKIKANSASYVMFAQYLATDIAQTIEWSQRYTSLAQNIAQDYLPQNLLGQGFLGGIAAFAAQKVINNKGYKQYLDDFALGGVNKEISLLSRRLQDVAKPINERWTPLIKEKIKTKIDKRNKILSQAALKIDDSGFINDYIQAISANEHDSDTFYRVGQLLPNSPESIEIEKQFNDSKERYNNYRDAFSDAANNVIYAFSEEEPLNKFIGEKRKDIQILSNFIQTLQTEEATLKTSMQKKEASFIGALTRWGDNIATLFGFKTKAMAKREQQHQKLAEISNNIKYNQIGITIQTDLLNRASAQIKFIDQTNTLTVTKLFSLIDNLLGDCQKTYQQIITEYKSASMESVTSVKLSNDQQKITMLNNKLNLCVKKLLDKLNDPKHRNDLVANISFSHIEKMQQKIKDTINSRETVNDIFTAKSEDMPTPFENLTITLNMLTNEKTKIAQTELLDSFANQVKQEFQSFSIEKFTDPFALISSKFETLSDLNDESKAKAYQHIQQQTKFLFEKTNFEQLTIRTLQNIYLQLQTGLTGVITSEKSNLNEALIKNYQALSDIIETKIVAYYNTQSKKPFNELKEILPNLQAELTYFNTEYQNAKKQHEAIKQSYDSSFNIGGFLISTNSVRLAKINELATLQQLKLFTTGYEKVLQNYFDKYITVNAFDEKYLEPQVDAINKNLSFFNQQGEIFGNIRQIHEKLLEAANAALAQEQKSNQLELKVNKSFEMVQLKFTELQKFTNNLNTILATPEDFNAKENYQKYIKLVADVNNEIEKFENNLQTLINFYKPPLPKNPELNLAIKLKNDQLEEFKASVTANKHQHLNRLEFYANLAKGESLNGLQFDKKTRGKGLIIAIKNNNIHVEALLSPAEEKIDIIELSAALTLAAQKTDLELFKEILNYRKDIPFNDAQIFQAIQAGFSSGNKDAFIQHLIFNTDFIPDSEAMMFIADKTDDINTPISAVNRGFMQVGLMQIGMQNIIDVDADGVTLDKLRKWFAFENQLIDSLKLEYQIIKQKMEAKPSNQLTPQDITDIEVLRNKLDKIEKINQSTPRLVEKIGFQNQQRKAEQLNKWTSEITNILTSYRSALDDMLNPPGVEDAQTLAEDVIDEFADAISEQPTSQKESVIDLASTRFENARKILETQIEEGNLKTPNQMEAFRNRLSELKHFAPDKANELEKVLQVALNKLATANQQDAMVAVLDICQYELKQEMMLSALSQAINAGSENAATLLIKQQAFKGHEDELMATLLKLIQERQNGESEPRHFHALDIAYQLLTHATGISLTDPNGKLDQKIINILKQKVFVTGSSTMAPVESTGAKWGFGLGAIVPDKDFAKLNELRQTYVFAQNAFEKLRFDIFLLLQPLIENDADTFTAHEISDFEQQINLINSSYQTQFTALDRLSALYQQHAQGLPFSNIERRDDNVKKWKLTQANTRKECNNNITKYIKEASDNIKTWHDMVSKKPALKDESIATRTSLLLSQTKDLQSNDASTPPEPALPPSHQTSNKPKF